MYDSWTSETIDELTSEDSREKAGFRDDIKEYIPKQMVPDFR